MNENIYCLTFNYILVDDLLVFPNELRFKMNSMDDSHLFQKRRLSRLPRTQQQKFHLKFKKQSFYYYYYCEYEMIYSNPRRSRKEREISIKRCSSTKFHSIRYSSPLFTSMQVILMTCNFQVEIGEAFAFNSN